MKTSANRLFDELNRKYWRGRLPRYRVIQRASVPGDGQCNPARRTILLGPHASPEDLRLTLLHEMCHIGDMRQSGPTSDHNYHGTRFLRKMRRLVRLGETTLMEKDLRACQATRMAVRGGGISFRDAIRSDIESVASEPELLRVRWSRVERWLAEKNYMTVSKLRRLAPWAERVWRERTAFERQERRLR